MSSAETRTSPAKTRRELNLVLLIGSLVFVVLAAPALYFWREFQIDRTSDIFLDRATALEQSEDFGQASSYLHRFLRLRPEENEDVRVRLAETFDQSATDPRAKQRALELYVQALGSLALAEAENRLPLQLAQNVPRLRRRLGQIYLELGKYVEAESEARELLEAENPDGWRLLALALYGGFQIGASQQRDKLATVGETFEKALALDPGDAELAPRLARIYRDHVQLLSEQQQFNEQQQPLSESDRAIKADAILDRMVKADPKNAQSRLARFYYREQYELSNSQDDLKAALQDHPDDVAVVLAAARYWHQQADKLTGEAYRLTPGDLPAPGTPDDAAFELGASTALQSGAAQSTDQPQDAEASGYYERARQYYQQLVDDLKVKIEDVYVGLGAVLSAQGKLDEAIGTWQRGVKEVAGENLQLRVRLADALINQRRLDEADEVLASLRTSTRALARRLAPPQKLALDRTVDLVQAKWYLQSRQHLKAIPLLRRITGTELVGPGQIQQLQAWSLLGYADSAVGQWDQAALAYQQAATLRPDSVPLRIQAAEAWMAAGRPETAIHYYQQALPTHASPNLWLALAQAQLQSQVRQPTGERQWAAFHDALAHATQKPASDDAPSLSDPWRAALLSAQSKIAEAESQGNRDVGVAAALALLSHEEEKHPSAIGLFQRLPFIYEQLDSEQKANDALRRFGELVPDRAAFLVAKARLLIGRGQFQQARQLLEQGLEELPETSHRDLSAGLVQIDLEEANLEDAEDGLSKLHDQDPDSIVHVRRLAELALEQNDLKGVKRWEDTLLELEGPTGTYWRHIRALRLIAESQTVQDPAFREAVELTAYLQRQRPSWPAAHVLKGLIQERQKEFERAIESYQEAIRLGDNRLNVYQRLIELLSNMKRFAEADRYFGMLQYGDSLKLDTLEISLAAHQGQSVRALQIARRAVERRPDDLTAHLWLGQMLIVSDKQEEAEKVIRHTVELAPEDERSWNGLFTFYLRTNQKEQARQTLESLANLSKLSESQRAFVLAQGYELLGSEIEAENYYRQAERLAPDNIAVMTRLAAFYLRRDTVKAIEVLEWLVKTAPDSNAARRTLAATLAERGEENDLKRALQLLEQSGDDRAAMALDRRLQAVLLAQRNRADHKQARVIMENLVADSPNPADGDRLLLAQICVNQSQLEGNTGDKQQALLKSARDQYLALVARSQPQASHLARFIEFLLQMNQREEAVRWLPKLETALVGADPPDPAKLATYIKYLIERNFQPQADAALGRLESRLAQDSNPVAETIETYLDLRLRHRIATGASDAVPAGNLAQWVDKLASLDSDSIQTLTLRARLLKAQGQTDLIEPLVEAFAQQQLSKMPEDEQRAQLYFGLSRVYTTVDLQPQAERWSRELVKWRPDRFDLLAAALVAQDRMTEAVKVCADASMNDSSARPAIILAAALMTGQPTSKDLQTAEPILAKAVREYPQNVSLLMGVASLRVRQGQTDEAARLYKRMLEVQPRDAVTLNNLAAVLAEVPGKEEEALSYIDQAIQLAGPQAALLDTKGTILLQDGRPSEAIGPLDLAVSSSRPTPLYHFHLAVAHAGVGNTAEARKHFQQALSGQLERQLLTPSDKKFLEALKTQLKE